MGASCKWTKTTPAIDMEAAAVHFRCKCRRLHATAGEPQKSPISLSLSVSLCVCVCVCVSVNAIQREITSPKRGPIVHGRGFLLDWFSPVPFPVRQTAPGLEIFLGLYYIFIVSLSVRKSSLSYSTRCRPMAVMVIGVRLEKSRHRQSRQQSQRSRIVFDIQMRRAKGHATEASKTQ